MGLWPHRQAEGHPKIYMRVGGLGIEQKLRTVRLPTICDGRLYLCVPEHTRGRPIDSVSEDGVCWNVVTQAAESPTDKIIMDGVRGDRAT